VKKVFIAGCGYIGERLARIFHEQGCHVSCVVRSPERREKLSQAGYDTVAVSLDDASSIPRLPVAGNTAYYLVPPPGGGTRDTRAANFIEALSCGERPSKIIYMSATSVYSEVSGGVVTEDSPTHPASAMGKRRLDAEATFRRYGGLNGVPVVILRVSGIYGPGRLPLMQISQGQPLLREDESGPSNRIHADDLAMVCVAAAEKGVHGDIFNVSDGQPTSMTHYFNACADALGLPRQPQVTLEEAGRVMSPLMLSYVRETRIVDNLKMMELLGTGLRYEVLAEGIEQAVRT